MNISESLIADVIISYEKVLKDLHKRNIRPEDYTFSELVKMVYEELE